MSKKIQLKKKRGQYDRTEMQLDKIKATVVEKEKKGLEDHRGRSPKRDKPSFTGDRFPKQ